MWDDEQLIALKLAPAARVTLAQLHEEYRSLELVMPSRALQFVLTDVDLNQRARSDQWIHRVIGEAYVSLANTSRLVSLGNARSC